MPNALQIAQQTLLAPAGLNELQLHKLLGQLSNSLIDYADLYFQATQSETWSLEDGIVKEAQYDIDQGVGVRAISGEKTGFAYTNSLHLPALTQAVNTVKQIASHHQQALIAVNNQGITIPLPLYTQANPLTSLTDLAKIAFLQKLERYTRALDPRIKQVILSLSGEQDIVLIINHHGHLAADIRPLVHLSVSVIVEQQGRREQGSAGGGLRGNYHYFSEENRAFTLADEALRQALLNLEAVAAPAGMLPVVLGPGWPGVLLHEAIGHGLEGDFNRKQTSAFTGKIGQQVAAKGCTIVDNGTLPNRRGSLTIDDEGTPTSNTVLIEEGILKGYLHDKLSARLMKQPETGNGRRESYASAPLPRMTNTYLLPGKYAPEEIIASVDKGIYAVNFGGGQVDITSGKFVFSASEAYLIEKGKLTYPIKGATLIGNGTEVLRKISMLGNDLKLDAGIGTCGKEGQSVPVGVGQPTLKIDAMTVGGTQQ